MSDVSCTHTLTRIHTVSELVLKCPDVSCKFTHEHIYTQVTHTLTYTHTHTHAVTHSPVTRCLPLSLGPRWLHGWRFGVLSEYLESKQVVTGGGGGGGGGGNICIYIERDRERASERARDNLGLFKAKTMMLGETARGQDLPRSCLNLLFFVSLLFSPVHKTDKGVALAPRSRGAWLSIVDNVKNPLWARAVVFNLSTDVVAW